MVSVTLNHSLFLAMHEVTHNLFFKSSHRAHHIDLGEPGVDTDVPSVLEAKLFREKFVILLWLLLQFVTYTIRPLF